MLDPKTIRMASAMSGAVLTKALMIFLGYFIGSKLDAALNTSPLFLLFFLCLGTGLGLWYLLRIFENLKK